MKSRRIKTLGLYLMVGAILQICLYLALSLSSDAADWLFYFDPRMGIFFIESGLRGAELVVPGIFQWLSAVWILLLGLMLIRGRPLVKTYIVSEIILSLPNVFRVVPLVLAFRTRRQAAGSELPDPARA
jgi:hypothetical protein